MNTFKKSCLLLSMILIVLGVSACKYGNKGKHHHHINKAIAIITPTEGNKASGIVVFEQLEKGVKVTATLTGLSGTHGFHVHEYGDMTLTNGKSAGGHFNPSGHKHAGPKSEESHVGDLGNVVANDAGVVQHEYIGLNLSLKGHNSILGRSVILHMNADDLKSQPTGAAGPRIGQGVIGVAK
jgi:superoxide dismutase, Cu-Zn family